MATVTSAPSTPPAPPRPGMLALRITWIAAQILLAFFFAQEGELFFYQGF